MVPHFENLKINVFLSVEKGNLHLFENINEKKNIIIIIISYDCAAMSVRRLYKMNYVCVLGPDWCLSVSGLVETIMAVMIRIETAVVSPIIGRGMMNVLIAAVVRTGQAIVSMSMPIAAISSISMTIMSISKAVNATFLRLLLTHTRL